VANRTSKRKIGCPYCSGYYASPDDNLTTTHPHLVKEIHPTKNGNLDAKKLRPGNKQKIWWICSRGHEWETAIQYRTAKNRPTGCPHCHKQFSFLEIRIVSEFESLFEKVIWQDKSFGVEIDVYLPEAKIGILKAKRNNADKA
jgi:hypothetical protein